MKSEYAAGITNEKPEDFGITIKSTPKGDDIYYPKNMREASVFDRSLANKTSALKEGETRRIIIDTADNVYFIEADGYMSGEILFSVPNNTNSEWLKRCRRSFLDGDFSP